MEIPFIVLFLIIFISVVGVSLDPDRYTRRKKKKKK